MKAYLLQQFQLLKTTRRYQLRNTVGVLLVIGGILGFLPVLGYWMLPLGLTLLAVDFAGVRRFNRRTLVWWGRRYRKRSPQPRTSENPAAPRNENEDKAGRR